MNVNAHNETIVITREVKVKKPIAEVAAFMTGAAQLGSWLSPVKSVAAELGGRIEFRAEPGFEHGGTYTTFDSPQRFVIMTDKFGQIAAEFEAAESVTLAKLSFSKSGDLDFEKVIADTITRFIAMVNYK
jgi:uncharacterized protein YndB with AHSA1/START domain